MELRSGSGTSVKPIGHAETSSGSTRGIDFARSEGLTESKFKEREFRPEKYWCKGRNIMSFWPHLEVGQILKVRFTEQFISRDPVLVEIAGETWDPFYVKVTYVDPNGEYVGLEDYGTVYVQYNITSAEIMDKTN